jgi:hypothetical protein
MTARSASTVHWSGLVDAAGLARRAPASMRSVQGITAVVGRSIQSLDVMANFGALLTVFMASSSSSGVPDCTAPDAWPAYSAFARLKDEGITDNAKVDFSRTAVQRLASEPIGHGLFRQVHLVTFFEKAGRKIEVITTNNASLDECSESSVVVYVVSRRIGEK